MLYQVGLGNKLRKVFCGTQNCVQSNCNVFMMSKNYSIFNFNHSTTNLVMTRDVAHLKNLFSNQCPNQDNQGTWKQCFPYGWVAESLSLCIALIDGHKLGGHDGSIATIISLA